MRRIEFAIVVVMLSGCASGLLAPADIRQADYVEKTTVKGGTAYTQALRWMDKTLRFVPGSPRSQDSSAGKMKMEAAYLCNVFRKDNDFKEYYLTFVLDFEAQPSFVGLHFTQLRMENAEGEVVQRKEAQLSDAPNVERIKPCLKKMVASLLKAVESTNLTR